jgi:carbamoyl-phosphate synthase large subunit
MNENAVGRYMADSFHCVPSPDDSGYLEEFIEVCKSERVKVVLPQTTREISVLSRSAERVFDESGARIIASAPAAVEVGNNKYEVLEVFRRLGLPHPSFFLAKGERDFIEAVHSLGYPDRKVVIKPPVSNGMRGFRVLVESPMSLEQFLQQKPTGTEIDLNNMLRILRNGRNWPELLVTEYLPGAEYSVDVFRSDGTVVAIPRLRNVIRSGISFENSMIKRDDLAQFALAAAAEIGLEHAFGFQFKEDKCGIPKVLECNPRIQGTMAASVFAGVNPTWLSVKASLGWPIRPEETRVRDAKFYRYWGGVGVIDGVAVEI